MRIWSNLNTYTLLFILYNVSSILENALRFDIYQSENIDIYPRKNIFYKKTYVKWSKKIWEQGIYIQKNG